MSFYKSHTTLVITFAAVVVCSVLANRKSNDTGVTVRNETIAGSSLPTVDKSLSTDVQSIGSVARDGQVHPIEPETFSAETASNESGAQEGGSLTLIRLHNQRGEMATIPTIQLIESEQFPEYVKALASLSNSADEITELRIHQVLADSSIAHTAEIACGAGVCALNVFDIRNTDLDAMLSRMNNLGLGTGVITPLPSDTSDYGAFRAILNIDDSVKTMISDL